MQILRERVSIRLGRVFVRALCRTLLIAALCPGPGSVWGVVRDGVLADNPIRGPPLCLTTVHLVRDVGATKTLITLCPDALH